MIALNDNQDVINFVDFQIFEISRDFVLSILQFYHFIDEFKKFLITRTFDVQHDVYVRQKNFFGI
jgi:hypothetical protein